MSRQKSPPFRHSQRDDLGILISASPTTGLPASDPGMTHERTACTFRQVRSRCRSRRLNCTGQAMCARAAPRAPRLLRGSSRWAAAENSSRVRHEKTLVPRALAAARPFRLSPTTGPSTDVKEVRFILFDGRAYDAFAKRLG
ncbi:hypothetical protein GCM10010276_02070 [Streptomyces longisporus]|uniref:Uncharacterized protein n=1 Tax=Streptomyces longisporus TaxID=1948 RepID=A0ABN3KW96_STRLO